MINFLNKYKLFTSLILVPTIVFFPISGGNPIGWGGWGIDIWPRLVILLLMYVLIYHYLYKILWRRIENLIQKYFHWAIDKLGGFHIDACYLVYYLEDITLYIEYICYHYYLYFLYIM
uniref:Ymf72 n=1 Tax=Tetrahymena thermophila TaxID=5911 RepID=Q950Z6_TETTH|nr:ymf72 [Tetrahymena thermophila]AAK77587.1 ymf72 [Tetrahymena thermophila]